MEKKCNHCKNVKSFDEFHNHKKSKDGKDITCKPCKKKQGILYRLRNKDKVKQSHKDYYINNKQKHNHYSRTHRQTLEGRFSEWRSGAANRGIEWNLTIEQIKKFPMICFYTKKSLVLEKGNFNTVSLERLDSKKSYCIENVVFCSTGVNYMKGDSSIKDFLHACSDIASNKENILKHSSLLDIV